MTSIAKLDPKDVVAQLKIQLTVLEKASPAAKDPPPKYNESDPTKLDKLAQSLESKETQEALEAEIDKLKGAAQGVEMAFRNVSRGMEKIVAMAKDKKDSTKFKKLNDHKTKWDGLHKKYVDLVWESRRVAGNARAIATDFAEDFLCVIADESYSVEEKREEMAAYKQELEKDIQNAAKLSQGFADLRGGVTNFRTDLNTDLKTWAASEIKQMEDLIAKIDDLEKKLAVAADHAIKATLGGLALGAGAGVLTAIGVFCPVLWIASALMLGYAAYEGYKAYKYYFELKDKRDELKKLLEEHTKAANKLQEIIAGVGNLENDMLFIQDKLAIFAQVWSMIRSDLVTIETDLQQAYDTSGRLTTKISKDRFKSKINTVRSGYKALAHALRLYETNVHL